MKFKTLLLAGALLTAASGMAQTPAKAVAAPQEPFNYSLKRARVPVWLDVAAGINVADCYDVGTVPFRYSGFGAATDMGVTIEWGRCHIRPGYRMFNTTFTQPAGTALTYDFSTEFLYRFSDVANNRLHFWVGGTLGGMIDVKSIPSLQNASACLSLFGNMAATCMMQYDFAYSKSKDHNWLSTYLKVNLPLYGGAVRPGYSYIGNPTVNQDVVSALIGSKESFGKFFPGVNTDLGLYLNLLNGNRIGLTYRWDYVSTGKKGTYRYDNALHSVNVSFMFRLN